jgi:hypothetical protein
MQQLFGQQMANKTEEEGEIGEKVDVNTALLLHLIRSRRVHSGLLMLSRRDWSLFIALLNNETVFYYIFFNTSVL